MSKTKSDGCPALEALFVISQKCNVIGCTRKARIRAFGRAPNGEPVSLLLCQRCRQAEHNANVITQFGLRTEAY